MTRSGCHHTVSSTQRLYGEVPLEVLLEVRLMVQ